jgi:mono/diheme cytochrome c family protein
MHRQVLPSIVIAVVLAMLAPAMATMGDEQATVIASKQAVFTREQAARGREQYQANCSTCHMEDLAGGGPALPLAGDVFMSRWSNQTVYDLYQRIRTTMPQSAPATLKDPVYLDIVAFILRANNFPVGSTELPKDAATLSKTLMSAGY